MICRNCSAEIEDRAEKCPFCHKDPRKRNHRGKAGPIICVLLIAAVAATVFIGLNFDEVKSRIALIFPDIKATSAAAITAGTEPLSSATVQPLETTSTSSSVSSAPQSETATCAQNKPS